MREHHGRSFGRAADLDVQLGAVGGAHPEFLGVAHVSCRHGGLPLTLVTLVTREGESPQDGA
ncbi:hypothetical protein GCM10009603_57940 [Nocardiopsis exhalans]